MPQQQHQQQQNEFLHLFPPFRFRCAEEGVYLGAYPTLPNMRFLQRLQLKSIVSLIPEAPISDLREFCAHEQIDLTHLPVPKFKDCVQLRDEDQLAQLLSMMIDARRLPMYIHCLDGSNVCSHVVMCLRRLQNVSWKFALQEANRHCDELSEEDLDFVRQLRQQLVVHVPAVENTAKWIARQLHSDVHPPRSKKMKQQMHPQGIRMVYLGVDDNFTSSTDDSDDPDDDGGVLDRAAVSGARTAVVRGRPSQTTRRGVGSAIKQDRFYANMMHQSMSSLDDMVHSDGGTRGSSSGDDTAVGDSGAESRNRANRLYNIHHPHHGHSMEQMRGKWRRLTQRYNDPLYRTIPMQALALELPPADRLDQYFPLAPQKQLSMTQTAVSSVESSSMPFDPTVLQQHAKDQDLQSLLELPKNVIDIIEDSLQQDRLPYDDDDKQEQQQQFESDLLCGNLDDEILKLVMETERIVNMK